MKTLQTATLDLAYLDEWPADGTPILLLHGWPDDPTGMEKLAELLHHHGHRTIRPWLRGFGPSRFRDPQAVRDGRDAALAQDALDLLDALGIERCPIVGHDWGARVAYALAAVAPERVEMIATLSIGYVPGAPAVPGYEQAQRWWYQWFLNAPGGVEKVAADPVGFARAQWENWSPPGWFTEVEFAAAAASFRPADWTAITAHGYRSRWLPEPVDHRYDALQARIVAATDLHVPALVMHGAADRCFPPPAEDASAHWFKSNYRRVLLPGVGHFPAREAPDTVASLILDFHRSLPKQRAGGHAG